MVSNIMPNIIEVIPAEPYFSVSWMLGLRCNYDCMYCPPWEHNNFSPHHNLETLQNAWTTIYEQTKHKNRRYKVSFTGGEVTANKYFLSFVQWLNSNYDTAILITTNGSASLKYYKEISKDLLSISFSLHSEHVKEKEFFEKVRVLNEIMERPAQSFHLNIMDEYWNQDRIPLYVDFCEKHQVSYSINKIDFSRKTRDFIKNEGRLDLTD